MATRATYSFTDKQHRTYIYIHHDGYPEGAASYFYHTIINPSKGNFATQFIRANPQAEITASHKIHGDTDYKYDITGTGLKATIEAYSINREDHCEHLFYSGTLYKFISTYSDAIQDYYPFHTVQLAYTQEMMNVPLAKIALVRPLLHLQAWKGKFEGSANWESCVQEAQMIIAAFPELMTPELATFGIKIPQLTS